MKRKYFHLLTGKVQFRQAYHNAGHKTEILILVFFILTISLSAQENLMDLARRQEYLHPETALVLVGANSGSFNILDLPADPIEVMEDVGLIVPLQIRQQLEDGISSTPWTSIGAFSFLVTQFYDIPGGLLYSIIRSTHYATKELQHLGLLDRHLHPRQPISGSLAAEIVERVNSMLANGDIR